MIGGPFVGDPVDRISRTTMRSRRPGSVGLPVVPVVRLTGVIGVTSPIRPGLTLATVARVLDRGGFFNQA